jgi:hypothetical protein
VEGQMGGKNIYYIIAVIAVIAVVTPNKIPGTLHIIIGQSFLVFDEPYNVHAAQLIAVIIGKTIDP